MPAKASCESAAKPPGPVMWNDSPSGRSAANRLMSSARAPIVSQPPEPALIGTSTCSALPSSDGIGPTTWRSTSCNFPYCATCRATACWSAGLIPDDRSYTRTAGISSSGENCSDDFSTSVDSALPGNQDTASFSWAPVSLLAGPKAAAMATIHSTSTIHLDTLPHGNAASRPAPATRTIPLEGRQPTRRAVHNAPPHQPDACTGQGQQPSCIGPCGQAVQPVRAAHSSAGR